MADRRRPLLLLAVAGLLAACSPARTAEPTDTRTVTTSPAGTASTVDVASDAVDSTAPAQTSAGPSTTVSAPVGSGVPETSAPATSEAPASTSPTSTAAPATAAPITTLAPPSGVPPAVDAAAYAVYDMRSHVMLAGQEADTPLAVGSLMKLLTAHVAYGAGQPTKMVTAPGDLLISQEESAIGIVEGQPLPRDLLIRAMLIVSANDATRLLAIDIAGSEAAYAELMNGAAANLGLTNTRAVNVTGLDAEGQHSTANDMIRLGAHLMGSATFQLTAKRTDATLNGQTLPATNDLLGVYPGADGIKTGRTTDAGWCILASANRDGRRIVVAVLGAPTEDARTEAATALLDWAFTR